MQSASPLKLITLTTDFGLADHYVGTMRGVIVSRCPGVQLLDISHEIPAFSLYAGTYAISQAAPFFPPGTVHVVVIDPGVGTSRRALLVKAAGQYFIAPDNGVLSLIVARAESWTAWEITNRSLWLPNHSATFHGRDVFAPVAAALASQSIKPEDVGPVADQIELLTGLEANELHPGEWEGKVLSVDRFGNVISNFRSTQFASIRSQLFQLSAGDRQTSQWRETFGAADAGECFVYFGSSGYLEMGINQGKAASLLKTSPGDSLLLRLMA